MKDAAYRTVVCGFSHYITSDRLPSTLYTPKSTVLSLLYYLITVQTTVCSSHRAVGTCHDARTLIPRLKTQRHV